MSPRVHVARQLSLAELSTRIEECKAERDRALAAWQAADVSDDGVYYAAKDSYWRSNSGLLLALSAFHSAWLRGVR